MQEIGNPDGYHGMDVEEETPESVPTAWEEQAQGMSLQELRVAIEELKQNGSPESLEKRDLYQAEYQKRLDEISAIEE